MWVPLLEPWICRNVNSSVLSLWIVNCEWDLCHIVIIFCPNVVSKEGPGMSCQVHWDMCSWLNVLLTGSSWLVLVEPVSESLAIGGTYGQQQDVIESSCLLLERLDSLTLRMAHMEYLSLLIDQHTFILLTGVVGGSCRFLSAVLELRKRWFPAHRMQRSVVDSAMNLGSGIKLGQLHVRQML